MSWKSPLGLSVNPLSEAWLSSNVRKDNGSQTPTCHSRCLGFTHEASYWADVGMVPWLAFWELHYVTKWGDNMMCSRNSFFSSSYFSFPLQKIRSLLVYMHIHGVGGTSVQGHACGGQRTTLVPSFPHVGHGDQAQIIQCGDKAPFHAEPSYRDLIHC